jgi:nitroreductase
MDLTTAIKERRTIKRFKDEPVSPETVTALLETAVWAPNHKMTQPWRFIMAHGSGRDQLAEAARESAILKEKDPERRKDAGEKAYLKLRSVPLILLVVMKEDPNLLVREEDFAATSCVIHNFTLLAWEQGLGTIWATSAHILAPEFRKAAGVQPGEKIVGSIHVGYPDMIPKPQERKPVADLLTISE